MKIGRRPGDFDPPQVRPSLEERFWSKVDRSGGPDACHPYTGGRGHWGHGRFSIGRRNHMAHRVAFKLIHGLDPVGQLRHSCDNPPCCNGAHLLEGTHADNMADMAARGRASRHGGSARGDRNGARRHPETRQRGAAQPNAKLTEEAVREMRRLFETDEVTTYDLAAAYGVSQSLAHQVVSRRAWTHVS